MLPIAEPNASKGVDDVHPLAWTEPVVVIDAREKLPYKFPAAEIAFLNTGDYSLHGFEDRVAIERKSKSDAYRSVGHMRERFRREFERLAALDYAAVIVECSLADFMIPPPFSELHPSAAVGTLLSWSVRHRVPVYFAGDREHGQWLTQYLLTKYAWYAEQEDNDVR
jgi:DNA excision repair protein ERCC-4